MSDDDLRDTFAAAALTGLLSSHGIHGSDYAAYKSYLLADAMLAERASTNHDAGPAARARTDADRDRTDKAATRPGEGTGNTSEPVAWAVMDERGLQLALHPTPEHASYMACTASVGAGEVVPLYRAPTLTDAEREAILRLIEDYEQDGEPASGRCVSTLRGLLERTK